MPAVRTEDNVWQEKHTPALPRGFWRRHYHLVNGGSDLIVDLTIRHAKGLNTSLKTRLKSYLGMFPKLEKATEEEVQEALRELLQHEDVTEIETPDEWRNF